MLPLDTSLAMAQHSNSSVSVAVIGLGAQGLVTVKNMFEEGYSVVGYEKSNCIGGIWHYTARSTVEALPSTVVNVSRQRACFTDFPFPQCADSFPTAGQIDDYLNQYADYFGLRPYLKLSTVVSAVRRNNTDTKWELVTQVTGSESDPDLSGEEEIVLFDKVIVAVGPHSIPEMPELRGRDRFQGSILHSIDFKDPSCYAGKRVMIVGVGNTAADTATSLVSHASSVYLAHRNGAAVIPRILRNGSSIDHSLTYRLFSTKDALDFYFPSLSKRLMDNWLHSIVQSEWGGYDPQWRMSPIPSLTHQVPTVSDTLISCLKNKSILSIAAPRRVTGPEAIELEDGETVDVDVIVFCTGYKPNLDFLDQHDPTVVSRNYEQGDRTKRTLLLDYRATPLLYQNVFSLDYPDSLAFSGQALISFPAFVLSDLSSMAVAQLWSVKEDSPSLPSRTKMYAWWDEHLTWSESIRRSSPSNKFPPLHLQSGPWLAWVQETIGANVDEHLSMLSWRAWRFWIQDRAFCNTLVHGVASPHLYRLFDSRGRRKSWNGARAAIEAVNRDVQRLKEAGRAASLSTDSALASVREN